MVLFLIYLIQLDTNSLKLWRYNDPVLGPRKLPEFDDYKKDKTEMNADNAAFVLDVEKKLVSLNLNNQVTDIGRTLIYVLE